jgi:short-subunit dehydrogenase
MSARERVERGEGRRPTALVTGASGGIGLELARLFAADGYDLVLVARTGPKLEETGRGLSARHGVRVRPLVLDLADPAAPEAIAKALAPDSIEPDALVNNAGIGVFGRFAESDGEAEARLLQVNLVALTRLTKLVLPGMIARRRGRILNVASTAAFQPGPLMAVYYASKAYVVSFSEALAEECRGTGVTVTALCPGPTLTGFQAEAKMERSRLVGAFWMMTADAVARAGYRAMMRGKRMEVPGLVNRIHAAIAPFVPRSLAARIVRRAQELRGRGD